MIILIIPYLLSSMAVQTPLLLVSLSPSSKVHIEGNRFSAQVDFGRNSSDIWTSGHLEY